MKTMIEYHYLYLKCDVLMLDDVFEKIRNRCLDKYGLRRSHYLNAEALSWDAMLSMTKVELNLLSDLDIYLFYKKGMRAADFYLSKMCFKANNKYLTSYDPKKPANIYYILGQK